MQLGENAGAQLLAIVADGEITPDEYERLEQSMVLLDNIAPVSYTHLDVYKRQLI